MVEAWTPEAIRAFRKSLHLTQAEFARELGVSRQQSVSSWECLFHEPSPTTAVLLNQLWDKHHPGTPSKTTHTISSEQTKVV